MGPVFYQRLEGTAIFVAATAVYFSQDFSWLAFALLLFLFDISMLGYLANPRLGAALYNIGHSFTIPALLTIVFLVNDSHLLLGLICIWLAHIGLDRALGYGLKLTSGFKHTHLGDIGK